MALTYNSPVAPRTTTLLGVVVVVAVLYFAKEVFIPLALAILLSFLLTPVVARLQRWGLGRVAAVVVVLIVSTIVSSILILGVMLQFVDLANELPSYQRNIRTKIRSFNAPGGGIFEGPAKMIRELSSELTLSPSDSSGTNTVAPATPEAPVPVTIQESGSTSIQGIRALMGSVLGPLATAGLVIVFMIFMLIQREDMRDRVIRLVGAGQLNLTTQALDEGAERVSRYLLTQLIVNASYGVPIALGLFFIGVPNPALWGLLATLLRFIPYAGPIIAAVIPIGLAFAVDPGWTKLVLTIGLFLVLELIVNNVIEPWLYGTSAGVSSVAILVAAVFWTWLWGPVGLLLSTPLTVCLVVIGRYVPHLQFLSVMLGDEPVLSESARLYQRMLALDPEEALSLVEKVLEEKSVEELYDEVMIPALSLAEKDRHNGALDEAKERFIMQSMRSLIEDLADRAEKLKPPSMLLLSDGENTPFEDEFVPESPSVLCIPAKDEADELVALMLAQGLKRHKVAAKVLSAKSTLSDGLDEVKSAPIVCVSALPPFAIMDARYMCKRLRRLFPDLKIVVGLWTVKADEKHVQDRLSAATADDLVTTLQEALQHILPLANLEINDPMQPPPIPADEEERLAELRGLGLLDTKPEEPFDQLTREMAQAFEVPISLISLVDKDRQFFKSAVGLPPDLAKVRESPRETSICGHVVAGKGTIVVEDVLRDKRFANNPMLRKSGIRFYAGVPLQTGKGLVIGTLCIMDTKPRRVTFRDKALLQMKAEKLMATVESAKASKK